MGCLRLTDVPQGQFAFPNQLTGVWSAEQPYYWLILYFISQNNCAKPAYCFINLVQPQHIQDSLDIGQKHFEGEWHDKAGLGLGSAYACFMHSLGTVGQLASKQGAHNVPHIEHKKRI